MWLRFKAIRNFNKFLVLVLFLATMFVVFEIVGNISAGVEMTGDDYLKYALFWVSFLSAIIFINAIDFIIRSLDLIFRKP